MTRTPRVAAVVIVLAAVALLAWASCGGTETSPEPGPVRADPPPDRAPPRAPSRSRHAVDPPPRDAPTPPSRPDDPTPPAGDPIRPPPRPGEIPQSLETLREIVLHVADEGGAPVAGLWVHIDADQTGQRSGVRTDDSGTARFVAKGGPRRLDLAEKLIVGRAFLPVGIVTVDVSQSDVRVRLREGAAIKGRVVDENEAPVAGVLVSAVGPDGFHTEITSAADGAFRLAAPAGSTCALRLGFHNGAAFWPNENYEGALEGVAAGTTEVVLRCRKIRKDGSLSVLVVDPSGAPRPRAYVAVMLVMHVKGGESDKNGRCRFEELPVRELTVGASTLGDAPDELYSPATPVPVVPEGQEIVLQLRPAVVVRVVAVDAAGAAVARLDVAAKKDGKVVARWRTDASGRATLKLPPEAAGRIRIELRDERAADAVAPRGTADVDAPSEREIRVIVGK
jgi:hypothetical protein